jgi:hypothetical protein
MIDGASVGVLAVGQLHPAPVVAPPKHYVMGSSKKVVRVNGK